MSLSDAQLLYKQIDEILWKDWDPIGINDCEEARDEYHGYLLHVWRFKLQNTALETIAQYLYNAETDNMGLPGHIKRCRAVAKKVVCL